MTVFINAASCIKKLEKDNIEIGKGYFSQLKTKGKIPHHYNPDSKTKIYIYDEVLSALVDTKDPTRDAQREANSKKRNPESVFDESNLPDKSLADLSEDEMKEYNKEIEEKLKALESISTKDENESRPTKGSSASAWNTFKIMQQGLNYEIDRKVKERSLMSINDFKAAAEVILSPINQGMDNLAFDFKSRFPDISDEKIKWLLERTNQLKVDVQNLSF